MANSLRRFGKEFRLQLLQVVGHWSYWAMHVVFALIMVALFGLSSRQMDTSAEEWLNASLGTISTGLIILIGMLLAGMAAARASQAHFAEMMETYPTGGELLLADWLATSLAAIGLVLEPLAVAAWVGSFQSMLVGIFPFLWFVIVGTLLGSALTWWLSTWLKFRRWIFPLLAAVWAVLWIAPYFLRNAARISLPLIDILTRMQNADFHQLFGRLEPTGINLWMCLFLFGVGLAVIFFAIWLQGMHRYHRGLLPGLLGMILAIGFMLLCAFNFNSTLSTLQSRAVQNRDNGYTVSGMGAESITGYDVAVDMTAQSAPLFTVSLVVHNGNNSPLSSIPLALNQGLKVISASLPYQRQQTMLLLTPSTPLAAGANLTLKLVYQGELATYTDGQQIPVMAEFFQSNRALVGLDSLWLPVAGQQNITSLLQGGSLSEPVDFTLQVKSLPGVAIYNNLPESSSGTSHAKTNWLFFVASDRLVSEQVGSVRVVGSSVDLPAARESMVQIDTFYKAMQALFPKVKVNQLTLFINETSEGFPYTTTTVTDQTLVEIGLRYILTHIDPATAFNSSLVDNILNDFYTMSGESSLTGSSEQDLMTFLWEYAQTGGQVDKIQAALKSPTPMENALLTITRQSGSEGLQKAIEALGKSPIDGDDEAAMVTWLEEGLHVH